MTDAYEGLDDAPIGAAATIPLKGSDREKRPRKERTGKRRRGGGGLGLLVAVLLAVVLLAFVPILSTAFAKTPKDRIGISYGGGPIEGNRFQQVVEPGSSLFFNGIFDNLYLYPSDQRSYIISDGPESTEGAPDFVRAPTSDRVQVSFQVALYYKLNTDDLRAFHEELGLRYRGYTSSGWARLIRETFQPQVESAIQEEARRSTVADLFGDADRLAEVQGNVQERLSERLEQALGQRFFCGPSFRAGGECSDVAVVIKRVDVPDAVATAFEGNRTSEIEVLTKQNEIAQREAEAESIAVLNEALAESGDQYVLLKAIESGQINFWVLPDDSGVTLQAPDTGAGGSGGG
jgi:regulator of protease activity HflC (stomatin/prohibitin superfamily)